MQFQFLKSSSQQRASFNFEMLLYCSMGNNIIKVFSQINAVSFSRCDVHRMRRQVKLKLCNEN